MLKVAIVGAGTWGESHANIYNEHPNTEIVAICDIDEDKAKSFASRNGIAKYYIHYDEMLEKSDCDIVAIVTPDFLHRDIAIKCAQAKKHMIIEKPLATKREDVIEIVNSIEKNNVRAMVDLHNRWNPPFNSTKKLVSSGKFGKPRSAYMRLNDVLWVATNMLSWANNSSILWFLGSHSLDTLSWIIDSEPEEVFAYKTEGMLKGLGVNTVDLYQTTVKYKNGVIAQMENGWITPNGNSNINDFKFNILCESGKFDIDASSHNLLQVTTDKTFYTEDILVKNYVFGRCKGFTYESIRSFIDSIINGEKFQVSLREAANVSLALLAVMESAQTGKPVKTDLI